MSESCKLNLNYDSIEDRNKIAKYLGKISTYEALAERPMLSVVVVLKSQSPMKASTGFYKLARSLNLLKYGEDEYKFFVSELKKVFEYWRNK